MERMSTGWKRSATSNTGGDVMTAREPMRAAGRPTRSVWGLGLYLRTLAQGIDRTMLRFLNAVLCWHARRIPEAFRSHQPPFLENAR
jgi:hypothetical protein